MKRPEVTHPIYPGVYIQDQDPAAVEYEYDQENCSTCPGNEKTTEIMYNLHHDFDKEGTQIARCEFPGHGMACMWTVDESNQKSQGLQDMGEESSSCYMSLSQLLYGDKRYYDRIRLAIAWVYSELLKLENHPHLTVNELFTSKRLEKFEEANLIKAVVDPSFQSKEQFIKGDRTIKQHANHLLKHKNICVVQLQFALEKTVDISDFGLEIFCSIFACNIHILQSFSRQEKIMCMDRKTKNYGRFWYGKIKQICLENETFVKKYGGNLHLSRKLLKKNMVLLQFPRIKDKYSNPHDVYCPFEYGKFPVHHVETVRVFEAQKIIELEDKRDDVRLAPIFREVPNELKYKLNSEDREKKQYFRDWQLTEISSSKEMNSLEKILQKKIEQLEAQQDRVVEKMMNFKDDTAKDTLTNWINMVRRGERVRELLNDQRKELEIFQQQKLAFTEVSVEKQIDLFGIQCENTKMVWYSERNS